jgi:hypothetical protein
MSSVQQFNNYEEDKDNSSLSQGSALEESVSTPALKDTSKNKKKF